MPPTAFELDAVPIPRKVSGERKGGGGKRTVDAHAVEEEGKAYPLARNVVKEAQARMNLERANVLRYVGSADCLVSERFGVLSVKGRDICISTK